MRQDGRTGTTNILSHADLCAIHLGLSTFTPQLLDDLNDLIHARRANGMAAGL